MSGSGSDADGEIEVALESGSLSPGGVVRVGDTIRRPRREGSDLVAAVLLHLEAVGFDGAPRRGPAGEVSGVARGVGGGDNSCRERRQFA